MSALNSWLLAYLLNTLWQLPLLFAAASVASRLARPLGSPIEHRLWIVTLVAQVFLPASTLDTIGLIRRAVSLLARTFGVAPGTGRVEVIIGPVTTRTTGLLHLPPLVADIILIAYGCSALYFAARLTWGLWKTRRMVLESHPIAAKSSLSTKLQELTRSLPVRAAISNTITSPVTIGLRRHILLVPPSFLDRLTPADLDALLAHESAHMLRRDFAKNLIYGLLSLPVAFHPILWLTRKRLAESREMVCDEMAALRGRETYARSLLRLASMLTGQLPGSPLHAIGIFDANIFERRIMNLTQPRPILSAMRRVAIAALCAVVALVAGASAMALHLEVAAAQSPSQNPKSIHVKGDNLKIVTQVNPVYPAKAKAAGISGVVSLDATISKEGEPKSLKVVSGPRDLQMSALDAVRQWRWEPYLLNGDPIEVQTTVTVVFSLGK